MVPVVKLLLPIGCQLLLVDSKYGRFTIFIGQGFQGVVLTMILFIFIIVFCFQAIGKSVRNMEGLHSKSEQFFVWTFGVSLLGHVVSFMSVTYFDQIIVFWYLLLAVISVLSGSMNSAKMGKFRD